MIDAPAALLLPIGVALVVVAGLLSAMEAALARLTRAEAARLVVDNRRGAAAVAAVLQEPAPVVNVSVFLRLLAESAAAVCVTLVVAGPLGTWWAVLLVSGGVMAVVTFAMVGVSPRTVGRQHAERVACATVPAVRGLTRLLGPVARALVVLANAVTPGRGFRDGPFASEVELRELVDLATESQVIEADERQMVHAVFELGDTIVREVMVPRTDMLTMGRDTTLREAMSLFLRSGFSRIPVIGDDVDDVLGVLSLKDVARRLHRSPGDVSDVLPVEQVMRAPVLVPESKPVDDLLREMQRTFAHVALVIDEYGGTAGLVTIEDLIEEIVGEIADEYDREAPGVEPVEEGTYRVSARTSIDEVAELFGLEIEEEEVDSVGGLLAKALGKVPIPGSAACVGGLELTAERREGRRNRIATVLVRIASEPTPEHVHEEGAHR
ncbi:MAG: hemolysin family protein [Actinomycetes bacterium]